MIHFRSSLHINSRHVCYTTVYTAILSWLYHAELLPKWNYMGFDGEVTTFGVIVALLISNFLGQIVPIAADTRSYIISILHYIYFVPSVIIIVFSESKFIYYLSFFLVVFIIYIFSLVNVKLITVRFLKRKSMLILTITLLSIAILLQVAFGGLAYFNLNLERVYEFRRVAANTVPGIFGYIYSNIANVFIPLSLLLGVVVRSKITVILSFFASLVLFGMVHHKAVFFVPFLVLGLYTLFKSDKRTEKVGLIFIGVVLISALEVLSFNTIYSNEETAMFTSYAVRRTLLLPPLVDSVYIDFFQNNSFYYWSQSKLTFGLLKTPYETTAPFVIGGAIFQDYDMSANSGVLGAGYANAGITGVILYAMIVGIVISLLNSFGRRIGHELVAAGSLPTIINLITTSDLVTVLFSHGLVVLLLFWAFMPKVAPSARYKNTMSLPNA